MVRLCVFDLDGTLVNSIGDIGAAMNRALQQLGFPIHSEEEYCHFVGNGMALLCERALPEGARYRAKELIELYQKDYLANCCVHTRPYPGISEVLQQINLKGIKRAVLSNKPHQQTLEVIGTMFPRSTFDKIVGQQDGVPMKPNPAALLEIMKAFHVSAEDTLYVGDSSVDMKLGANAGVKTVGVAWGFRGRAELEESGARTIISRPEELMAFI